MRVARLEYRMTAFQLASLPIFRDGCFTESRVFTALSGGLYIASRQPNLSSSSQCIR